MLVVSCNGLKKNRVGRSVKRFFLHYFFGQKCVIYPCFTLIWSWEVGKNFRVGIFLNKNLLGQGYRKQTIFFLGLTGVNSWPWSIYRGHVSQGLGQDFKNACPNQQFQISARPDLATNPLQIPIPAASDSLVCQIG